MAENVTVNKSNGGTKILCHGDPSSISTTHARNMNGHTMWYWLDILTKLYVLQIITQWMNLMGNTWIFNQGYSSSISTTHARNMNGHTKWYWLDILSEIYVWQIIMQWINLLGALESFTMGTHQGYPPFRHQKLMVSQCDTEWIN